MITKETAAKIYNCHQEIENTQKLLTDMKKAISKTGETKLQDAFGGRKGLQLGVPSGDTGHRLYDVSPALAVDVIEGHRQAKEKELLELRAIALIELKG